MSTKAQVALLAALLIPGFCSAIESQDAAPPPAPATEQSPPPIPPSQQGQDPSTPPASPAQQEPRTREVPADTSDVIIDKALINDFGEITPNLYRGAVPRKHGLEALAKLGINIIVDLRGDKADERRKAEALGMQYVPMHWQCSFPKDKIMAEFLTLIRKNPDKKIFVHCRVGDDRTGMMIAAYRMAEQGWTAKQAMEEMQKYGFNFAHKRLICPRLSEYEEHFPEHFATKPEFAELRATRPSQPTPEARPSQP